MEYTCEVKCKLPLDSKVYITKTTNKKYVLDSQDRQEDFDINKLEFIDCPEFEGDVLQAYTELLGEEEAETKGNQKDSPMPPNDEPEFDYLIYGAKEIKNDEEKASVYISTTDHLMKEIATMEKIEKEHSCSQVDSDAVQAKEARCYKILPRKRR